MDYHCVGLETSMVTVLYNVNTYSLSFPSTGSLCSAIGSFGWLVMTTMYDISYPQQWTSEHTGCHGVITGDYGDDKHEVPSQ